MGKRVAVARLGSEVPDPIAFENSATVADALSAFEEELEKGEELAIDGHSVTVATVPEDGDVVYISAKSTGA